MALKFYQYNVQITSTSTCSITFPGQPVASGTWAQIMDSRPGGQCRNEVSEVQTPYIYIDENETAPNLVVDGVGTFEPVEFTGRRPNNF